MKPRRCPTCGVPVLFVDDIVLDDRPEHRGEEHVGVLCDTRDV